MMTSLSSALNDTVLTKVLPTILAKHNEISSDFADMLKDTYLSMQDRIEFANQDQNEAGKEIKSKFQQVQNMQGKWSWLII